MSDLAAVPDETPAEIKADDYANLITGLGTGKDKSGGTTFGDRVDLTINELDNLYEHEALAVRVIDRLVDDATREGFTLKGTDTEFDFQSVLSTFDDLDALNMVGDAWRWARLYGGSILVVNVNDNVRMSEPIELERATQILSLHVIESPFAQPIGFIPGLGSRAFRDPFAYDITTSFGADLARIVHASRVIRFDGLRIPPTRMLSRNGWGPSVLDRVWSELRRLGSVMGYSENILHEISVMMLKIKGFREQAAGSSVSKQELQRVFHTMRWALDNINTLVLDSEDEYTESTRTVAGLDALLGRFVDAVVRATDMPRTILLGEQPGGLNANADSEIRAWFDFVAAQQKKTLSPALSKLLDIEFQLRKQRGEDAPEEWTIEYASLWQPSDKEAADTDKVQADTDTAYVDLSVTTPEEVRQRLIKEGKIDPIEGSEPSDVEADTVAQEAAERATMAEAELRGMRAAMASAGGSAHDEPDDEGSEHDKNEGSEHDEDEPEDDGDSA